MSDYILASDGELYHYGVLGMKWGIRRYQNKDGSLTAAGKKRRAKLEGELEKLGGKKSESSDDSSSKSRKAKDMTDDELRNTITRLRLEDEYNTYYNKLNPQKTKNGKKYADTLISNAVQGLAEGSKGLIRDALIKKGKEALGIKEDEKKPKSNYEKLKEKYDLEKLDFDFDKLKADRAKFKSKGNSNSEWEDLVKELNNMSKDDAEALAAAAKIQENINKLKKQKD